MSKQIQNFDWNQFSINIEKLVEFISFSTQTPINGELWEEIIFHTLKAMGMRYKGKNPKWVSGSHSPGADLWIDQFAISAKGGSYKNHEHDIEFSSYRLTRFRTLDEMVRFLDYEGKNFDIYLCCVRKDTEEHREYKIYSILADTINATDLTWNETFKQAGESSGWAGISANGLSVKIYRNMSNQAWIQIPLRLCQLLAQVSIPKSQIGIQLEEVLKE